MSRENFESNQDREYYPYGDDVLTRDQFFFKSWRYTFCVLYGLVKNMNGLSESPKNVATEWANWIVARGLKADSLNYEAYIKSQIKYALLEILSIRRDRQNTCALNDHEAVDEEALALFDATTSLAALDDCCVVKFLKNSNLRWFLYFVYFPDDHFQSGYDFLTSQWPNVSKEAWRTRVSRARPIIDNFIASLNCPYCVVKINRIGS